MESILKYRNLIKEIPVLCQSAAIKRKSWERVKYKNKVQIENDIFGRQEVIELSRQDVFEERDLSKKMVKTLMWGVPTAGRGNNLHDVLNDNTFAQDVSSIFRKNMAEAEANTTLVNFNRTKGLGPSTWSKLLYFFDVSIDSNKCQIYDIKIVNSLNKVQFEEFKCKNWNHQNIDDYFKYVELMNSLSETLKVRPDQLENFLFYYNLGYKF